MKTAIEHLQDTHNLLWDSIEHRRKRIEQIKEVVQKQEEVLLEEIEQANAVQKAIDVLNENDDLPTRLEGSE